MCIRLYNYNIFIVCCNDKYYCACCEEKHGDYFNLLHDVINSCNTNNMPLFVYTGKPAPHRPAPMYNQTFNNHPNTRTPSYNYNSTDKH